jgi:catalase
VAITSDHAIDAANEVFGRHRGFRALHAKGTLCKGTFTAAPEAAGLTRAAHMQGGSVPANIRFSNGSGNPEHPDFNPDVRGMAVKIYLPDGARTDIVAQSAPRFPARTPEAFVELLRASEPGPAALWRLPWFLVRNPHAIGGLPANLPALKPPASYASIPYYAIHAYRWLAVDAGDLFVRYTFAPESPEGRISAREAKRRGADYLQDELRARLERGPVRFTLELQVATPGDNVEDPTAQWPAGRRRIAAGTLEVTGLETEREHGDDIVVFDPTRVTDGIELSADSILQFRAGAYGASVARRTPGAQ